MEDKEKQKWKKVVSSYIIGPPLDEYPTEEEMRVKLNDLLKGDGFQSVYAPEQREFRTLYTVAFSCKNGLLVDASQDVRDRYEAEGIVEIPPSDQNEYFKEGLAHEKRVLDDLMGTLRTVRDDEQAHLDYILLHALGNESFENLSVMYNREKKSMERVQELVRIFGSLKKVAIKLALCFSPFAINRFVLPEHYVGPFLFKEEKRAFKEFRNVYAHDRDYGETNVPLFEEVHESWRLFKETQSVFVEKWRGSPLYNGFFGTALSLNKDHTKVEEMRRDVYEFSKLYRQYLLEELSGNFFTGVSFQ